MLDDTITAIATPLGEGGLAVIRLSAPRAPAMPMAMPSNAAPAVLLTAWK